MKDRTAVELAAQIRVLEKEFEELVIYGLPLPRFTQERRAEIREEIDRLKKRAHMLTPREQIERALEAIHDAYWSACDAEGRAIAPKELLDEEIPSINEAYEIALKVESVMRERMVDWEEARQFV